MVLDVAGLKALKVEYAKHEHDPKAVFTFRGTEFLVGYAKYLIEYLDNEFTIIKSRMA